MSVVAFAAVRTVLTFAPESAQDGFVLVRVRRRELLGVFFLVLVAVVSNVEILTRANIGRYFLA